MTPVAAPDSAWRREGETWWLPPGRAGFLDVPAWWAGERPPEGETVVLAFDFEDAFADPLPIEAHAGLASEKPFAEVHRIGGLGDGAWRPARVPATADFIRRHLPGDTLRFRVTAPATGLRLKDPRLLPPNADEEARYSAETRAWIARAQARADIDAAYFDLAERPVLPPAWADRPLVPFARPWSDPVRIIAAPRAGEAGANLAVTMFRNEFEPVQLGVFANGRALANVRVTVDPPADAEGRPVATVTARVAEYAKVKGQLLPDHLVESFPQRLWPAFPFAVPAGRSQMILLDLRTTEATAKPGRFRGQVTLAADGIDPVTVPLDLTILDARLPTMTEAGLRFGGATLTPPPRFALPLLVDYNHNLVNLWYMSTRPGLMHDADSVALDFRFLDDWMAAAKRAGIVDVLYFLGGDPYRFPRAMHLPRTLAAMALGLDDKGWADRVLADPNRVPPEVAPLIVAWSRAVGAHAREQGWPRLILTPFDEPAKFRQYGPRLRRMLDFVRPQFREQVALLRQGDPTTPIYASIHDERVGLEFLPDIDIIGTNVADRDAAFLEAIRRSGKTFWEYAATTDRGLPAEARFVFGFLFAAHGSTGGVGWAYDWGERFDTLDGTDWIYAWTTPFDLIPTPYLFGLREAWDDRRLLVALTRAAAARGLDPEPLVAPLFAEIVATDATAVARDPARLERWRARSRERLMELLAR